MKQLSIGSFFLGMIILAIGVFFNLIKDGGVGGIGTMSMNGYYLLAIALFAQSAAAHALRPMKG